MADAGARFLDGLHERAAQRSRTLLFPEATDTRVIEAAVALRRRASVRPVLVRREEAAAAEIPSGIATIDPLTDPRHGRVVAHLMARRAAKGLTEAEAVELARDPLYFADALVALGEADGCVAGAMHTTAAVIRAALWTVGTAEAVRTVSSAFYMVVPPFRDAGSEVLTFTDCAVVPEPTAVQLAEIALAAARDRRRIVGDVPCVAFLSFSSGGSAEAASVARVREAAERLRTIAPSLEVTGEIQADAALIPEIAQRKLPADPVAGRANVLVFPSLDAGNIAYKLVQRLARATAIGPILQGLAYPCSDLSRGATVDDIVHVAAITALQADTAASAA